MVTSRDLTIQEVTDAYLDSINVSNPPKPAQIVGELLMNIKNEFDMYNSVAAKNAKWKIPDRLLPAQIADILVRLYPIVAIETSSSRSDSDYTLLGFIKKMETIKGFILQMIRNFISWQDSIVMVLQNMIGKRFC